mmetsp:Transcript_18536/g.44592  ORF Transcript_18536/g.44592 Transcript_18536/m.44592 type:complete len:83 (+) Transcript_18536:1046-1294(+)
MECNCDVFHVDGENDLVFNHNWKKRHNSMRGSVLVCAIFFSTHVKRFCFSAPLFIVIIREKCRKGCTFEELCFRTCRGVFLV